MDDRKNIESGVSELFDTVVKNGYCIGCGACASITGSPIKIALDQYSMFQASIDSHTPNEVDPGINIQSVCPFSNASENEDEIGLRLFGDQASYHSKLGYYISTYAGHVEAADFRDKGSSGGMGSWLATMFLQRNLVDGVIHVHQHKTTDNDSRLFHYSISYTEADVRTNSKSRYYPVELSEVLKLIRDDNKRYAIIGVPCFIKSIRLLTRVDADLNNRIKFCVGLVCGHLKSAGFAQMLAWQVGVRPAELNEIDFRTKLEDGAANRYGVTVKGNVEGNAIEKVSPPVNTLYGTNWGFGFFKYKACDYCDDVVAETADITIGDAWLPQYVKNSKGTNVIIVRNELLDGILKEEWESGNLMLDSITAEDVVASQRSGLDHRREGLAFRLHLLDQQAIWRPKKRVSPNDTHISELIKKRQLLRIRMAEESHIALKKAISLDDYSVFKKSMDPLLTSYLRLYRQPFLKRVKRKIGRILKKIMK